MPLRWMVLALMALVGCASTGDGPRGHEGATPGVFVELPGGGEGEWTGAFLPPMWWEEAAEEDTTGKILLVHRPVRRGTLPGLRRPPALRPPRLTPNQTQFWMRRTVDLKVVEQTRQLYWRRLREAQEKYPNSSGYENHHVVPTYLVGVKEGTTYRLPTAYHKAITQEFRREWGYGQRRPESDRLMTILIRVYSKYPIPQLVGIEP